MSQMNDEAMIGWLTTPRLQFATAAEHCIGANAEIIIIILEKLLLNQFGHIEARKHRNWFFSRLRWWFCTQRREPMCVAKLRIITLLTRMRWHVARNEAMRELFFRDAVQLALVLGYRFAEFDHFGYIRRMDRKGFLQRMRAEDVQNFT